MNNKETISRFQLGIMVYPAIISTAILIVPGITHKFAKQDMWLSPIVASRIGYFSIIVVYQLHKWCSNETIVQYSE